MPDQTEIPPSLQNIYKELQDDLGCYIPNNGYLKKWADQGVLMLNTVLTVRAHQAGSHQGRGWEQFTDAIIEVVIEVRQMEEGRRFEEHFVDIENLENLINMEITIEE